MNGRWLGTVKILASELNNLSEEKALELSFQQDFMKNTPRDRIQKILFFMYNGCRATIMISTLKEMNLEKGAIESVI